MSEMIESHVLRDGETTVRALSIGCCVQDWQVAGRRVVLGYADPEDYRSNPRSMGMVVGRVANRIGGGRFDLGGQSWRLPQNNGAHCLHGGPQGFGRRLWRMAAEDSRAVRFTLEVPHLDQGFPGALAVSIRLSLAGAALTWEMEARPDRPTPVNLCQHLYFNLAGAGDIRAHRFRIAAAHYTPSHADGLPTGEIRAVAGSRFDLRQPRILAQADPEHRGFDQNFVLSQPAPKGAGRGAEASGREEPSQVPPPSPQAEVQAPDGMRLRLWTDQPGLQFYTGGALSPHGRPWPGVAHGPFGGFCLEAQGFPDAVNQPGFPSVICTPEAPYRQRTTIEITPGGCAGEGAV